MVQYGRLSLSRAKILCLLIFTLMIIYSCTRSLFLYLNYPQFAGLETAKLAMALLHGLRFDLASICLINSIFAIIYTLLGQILRRTVYRRIMLAALFIGPNALMIVLSMGDIGYYGVHSKRISWHLTSIWADVAKEAGPSFAEYWHLWGIAAFFSIALCKVYIPWNGARKMKGQPPKHKELCSSL